MTETIYNATSLNFAEEWNGKGRHFTSRFLEAGLVSYGQDRMYLLRKETIDKFIGSMVGCPVIIKHADVKDSNVKDLSVGNISKVWFNDADGWFYCEGVLTDKDAVRLVEQGQSVSCGYHVLDKDIGGGIWHDIPYDAEILNGDFEHLAIVDNPRYRDANILLNSSEVKDMNLKRLFGSKSNEEKEIDMENKCENASDCTNSSDLRTILNSVKEGKVELTEELINSICDKEEKKDTESKDVDDKKDEEAEKSENTSDALEEKAKADENKDTEEEKEENKGEEADEEEKDNSCKNEAGTDETKADEKKAEEKSEKAEEKQEDVKNSSDFDKLETLKNSVYKVQEPKVYLTEAERLDAGKNY